MFYRQMYEKIKHDCMLCCLGASLKFYKKDVLPSFSSSSVIVSDVGMQVFTIQTQGPEELYLIRVQDAIFFESSPSRNACGNLARGTSFV